MEQLISVAIDIPERKLFTYKSATPLKPGQRVKVPFGKRTVCGWVVGPGIKGNFDYKSIIKVYDQSPVITGFLLSLASEMAENYFCSLGSVLGAMSKSLALTKMKIVSEITQTGSVNTAVDKEHFLNNILSAGQMRYIMKFSSTDEKKKFFLDLVDNCKGSCLIVFSNLFDVNRYSESLRQLYGERVIIFTGEMTKIEKSRKWKRMLDEKRLIIVGTRISLFSPVSDLCCVVVDEPSEYGHKENQHPKYNSREVAIMISKILNIPAIFTVFQPDVTDVYLAKTGNAGFIELDKKFNPPEVIITQIQGKSQKDFLTEISKHFIEKNVIDRRKVVIIHNIKGYARLVLCKKCGSILLCRDCGGSVVPVSDRFVYCVRCAKFSEIPGKCLVCKKGTMAARQPGIQKILLSIKSLYPEFSAGLVSDKGRIDFESDILIGTQHIVHYLEQISPGVVVFLNADTIAARSVFRSEEKFFLLAEKIKRIMQAPDKLIIQTRNPGMDVYTDVARNNYENFYRRELSIRENLQFPPFGELIEISFSGKKWQKNKDRVLDELRQYGEIYDISSQKKDGIWWKVSDRKKAFEILQKVIDKYTIPGISLDTTPYF